MQIIGIRLYNGLPDVIHNLKPGWYPFGNFEEPLKTSWKELPSQELYNHLYHFITENSLAGIEISVGCIVGKNGAGKSTLIDLYYRIINNLAYKLIEEKWPAGKIRNKGCNLHKAAGFSARLYFETDGKLGYIEYKNDMTSMLYDGADIDFNIAKEGSGMIDILSKLFYTICINYSIFSFGVDDYVSEQPQYAAQINGEWLRGIMHKNDGYLTPIVIHPYREEDGSIDMERENDLVKQRLATLSILFHAKGKTFLDAYSPKLIVYRIDTRAKEYYQQKFTELQSRWLPNQDVHKLHVGFYEAWNTYLKTNAAIKDEEVQEIVLSYLCYKSLKICLYYQPYSVLMGARLLSASELQTYKPSSTTQTQMYFNKPNYAAVVNKIVNEPISHVTLKIQQLLTCLQSGTYSYVVPKASKSSVGEHIMNIEDIESRIKIKKSNPQNWSYNDVYIQLPPTIFEWDIQMCKLSGGKEELVPLGKLSSGEKEKLQSASAILYHINNIQGVVEDEFRVPYHHINIIMDEAELYYHPEFQRKLISDILHMLSWCHIDSTRIKSVNILLATHSPFVLSDVTKDHVLYLDGGKRKMVENQTFAANIHELLRNQFFLMRTMGDAACTLVDKIVELYNKRDSLNENEKRDVEVNINCMRMLVREISEPYVQMRLHRMISELETKILPEQKRYKWIDQEIAKLQELKMICRFDENAED